MLEIKNIIKKLEVENLPPDTRRELKRYLVQLDKTQKHRAIRGDFLTFVKHMWPDFIEGYHHKIVAEKFNKLQARRIKRLIINMPPRHTKSEFASFLLPAWMIGKNPKLKIIQATHTAELAVRFGRKAKHLMDSEEYKDVFPTRLMEDSKAAGRWETEQGGEYFAVGVEGAVTGRGADLLIIDGGYTHLTAVKSELEKLKISAIGLVALSKGLRRKEEFDSLIKEDVTILNINRRYKAHLILQEIRDESHRFSIKNQRKNLAKQIRKSVLDDIQGVGSKNKLCDEKSPLNPIS